MRVTGGVTVGVKEAGLGYTATHIDCLAGEVFVAVDDRPLVQCAPGHGFIIRTESPASTP